MNLDELERLALEGARRDWRPSPEDKARNAAALARRVALEGNAAESAAVPPARAPANGGGLKSSGRWGLGTGLLLGGLLGFGLGWQLRAGMPTRATGSAPAALRVPARPAPAPRSGESRAKAAHDSEQAAALPAPAGQDEETASAKRPGTSARLGAAAEQASGAKPPAAVRSTRRSDSRARRAKASRPSEPGPSSTLAAELAMLQRARRALNRENGRLALGIVHSLDERFPEGVLLEERSATRILALCMLERESEAAEHARAFEKRHASSVYEQRIQNSCAGDP